MTKQKVGKVAGHEVYVETGRNEMAILEDKVRREVESVKLKDGRGFAFLMQGEDGKMYMIKTTINRMKQDEDSTD